MTQRVIWAHKYQGRESAWGHKKKGNLGVICIKVILHPPDKSQKCSVRSCPVLACLDWG